MGSGPTTAAQPTDGRGGSGGGRSANGGFGGLDGVAWRWLRGQANATSTRRKGVGLGHRGEEAPSASTAVADEHIEHLMGRRAHGRRLADVNADGKIQ